MLFNEAFSTGLGITLGVASGLGIIFVGILVLALIASLTKG